MFIASLIVGSAIVAGLPVQTPPLAADAAFVRKAAAGGTAEVALARLAQAKAAHEDVKAFAATLEEDHSAAHAELQELAGQKKIRLADAAGHGPVHARLEKLSGAAFDRAFVAAMAEEHRKDVEAFGKAASGAADRDVKAFAAKMLPTLTTHLRTAQELSTTVGAKKPTS